MHILWFHISSLMLTNMYDIKGENEDQKVNKDINIAASIYTYKYVSKVKIFSCNDTLG